MRNIIEYMYRNIESKDKIIAEYMEDDKSTIVHCLKSKDIIRFSNYLNTIGYEKKKKKKIGILMENCLGFVNAFYSVILNGNIVVGINTKVGLEELNTIIEKNKLNLIIEDVFGTTAKTSLRCRSVMNFSMNTR